VPQFLTNE
jgi:hypothetical protein